MQNQNLCLICKCPLSSETLRCGVRYFCEHCGQYEIVETHDMKERNDLVIRPERF